MELRQLQYLSTIARAGGFRRAADELDMSQATLSEQIKFLELELGVRLFERSSRTLTLTEPGKVLLERAERVLKEVRTAQEEMLEFAHLDRGQLIVGTMTGTGSTWLPGFLAAFMRRYPHVDLTLVERASGILLKLLANREIHVACVLVPADGRPADLAPDISIRPVFTRELMAVVAPRHRLAALPSVTLEMLSNERMILTSPDEGPRQVIDRAFRSQGLEPQVSFEADDPATLIGLAAEGIAIGITGEHIARRHVGRVVGLPFEGEGVPLRYSIALAWSERGPHTRAVATWIDFATEWLSEWGQRTGGQVAPLSSVSAIS